jgi:hypothetical protein
MRNAVDADPVVAATSDYQLKQQFCFIIECINKFTSKA